MQVKTGYTFDDVLLTPKHSTIKSRDDVDLSVNLGKDIRLKIPLISANMKTVTGPKLAKAIIKLGGLPILHRFMSLEEQLIAFDDINASGHCGVSVGIKNNSDVDAFYKAGAKIICVDVAHADHDDCFKTVNYIHKTYPDVLLIAGNISTISGAKALKEAGADIIKCGQGSGSLCTTRIETGNGVPQLTALNDIFNYACGYSEYSNHRSIKIIADGGLRRTGDCVKALVFSDCVMLGNMLAGTTEAPGETITVDGHEYKSYVGSSTHKTHRIEGVAGLVPAKGPISEVIRIILEGIQSGLSYQGCKNLEELKMNPQFVTISHAGLLESHPHTIVKQ